MRASTLTFLIGAGGAAALAALIRRSRAYDLRDRVVVVTGGSRGLGLVLARHFAAEGAHLVLLARDAHALEEARRDVLASSARGDSVRVHTIVCDLREQAAVGAAIREVIDRCGRIDVLVNNAGVIQMGPLEHMGREDFAEAMGVHLFGALDASLAALPHLERAPGGGRIVNIASIGGKVAVPHLLPYCASKFALVGLSDGMRAELRRRGVRVTTVIPGLMRTGSPPNARFRGRHRQEYAWFLLSDALPLLSIDADRAARKIVAACRRGAARLTIGPQARLAALASELLPRTTAAALNVLARLLPRPLPAATREERTGWESASFIAPSFITLLSDRATERNNEAPRPNGVRVQAGEPGAP